MESVNYQSNLAPAGYRCARCGATGCKLWRQYQTLADRIELLCAIHAAENQGKDIATLDKRGTIVSDVLPAVRCDQIGWLVPAVPTEEGDAYWGYTSVPTAGCAWWARLPSLPNPEEAP